MCIKSIKICNLTVRFSKYVVMFILLSKVIVGGNLVLNPN